MTGYVLDIVLNHSIALPAIAGIVRVKTVCKSYCPFLLFLWLGLLNETISLILIYQTGNNLATSNIYVLLEYLILLYQFHLWSGDSVKRLALLSGSGIFVWVLDNLLIHSLNNSNSIFRSLYSFVLLLLSIDKINSLLIFEKRSLLKNPTFLICTAFLFYYGFKSFFEAVNIFDLDFSDMFYRYLWVSLSIINCIANIIFTLAILWVPKRQTFFILY